MSSNDDEVWERVSWGSRDRVTMESVHYLLPINARVRWALCLVCVMVDWGKEDDGCCLSLNKIEYGILFELAHADEKSSCSCVLLCILASFSLSYPCLVLHSMVDGESESGVA